jgi:UDP-sugar transporter A1/2/3
MAYIKENKGSYYLPSNMYSLKSIILISLCLQNAGYTLLRKYTTKYENVSSKEILLVSEIVKVIFSVYMVLKEDESKVGSSDQNDNAQPASPSSNLRGVEKIVWLIQNSSKMLVLAVIYGIMNILSFIALQYIGAGEFTICAQLKILTTAVFSVVILGTTLSWGKWRSLFLLVLGCVLVASPVFNNPQQNETAKNESGSLFLQLFGYSAVLTEVVLSGFASIYFEKVIKNTKEVASIWERNVQLGYYSILMYGGILIYENNFSGAIVQSTWSNWSWITLSVCALGATGGLLVAATLKYADSILKTLAAAGAIVMSTILGHYFLNGPLDTFVIIGAMVTIIAIANYTFDSAT